MAGGASLGTAVAFGARFRASRLHAGGRFSFSLRRFRAAGPFWSVPGGGPRQERAFVRRAEGAPVPDSVGKSLRRGHVSERGGSNASRRHRRFRRRHGEGWWLAGHLRTLLHQSLAGGFFCCAGSERGLAVAHPARPLRENAVSAWPGRSARGFLS